MIQPEQYINIFFIMTMVTALVTLSYMIDASEFEDFQEEEDLPIPKKKIK